MKIKAKLKNKNKWVEKEFLKCSSNVVKASENTDKVFLLDDVKIHFPQNPYPSQWYCYDLFYKKIALPELSLLNFINDAQSFEKIIVLDWDSSDQKFLELYLNFNKIPHQFKFKINNLFKKSFNFFIQFFLLCYSFISIIILSKNKNDKIAIWTGDYTDKEGGFDPRLGDLKRKLKKPFVEFIRTNGVNEKSILKNLIKRKRPCIYYSSIQYFFHLFSIKKNLGPDLDFKRYCLLSFLNEVQIELCIIHTWEYIFKKINIKKFIIWFFSHRTAGLLWASKKGHIPTIGFMHGLTTPYHMGHEYLRPFTGSAYGPDKFGVWSEYWKIKYQSLSQFYPKDAIEVSGILRPLNIPKKSERPVKDLASSPIIHILFVAEQSIPPEQIYPYIEALSYNSRFKLYLKIRNFGIDSYFLKIQKDRPDLLKHLTILSKTVAEAMDYADVVIGSHSTVILESSLYLKPFIFIETAMWGDYYDIKSLCEKIHCPYRVIISEKDQISSAVQTAYSVNSQDFLNEISKVFFGNQSISGTDWICRQLGP